jgi:hypothetical protein
MLTPAEPVSGFSPSSDELLVSRNGKGSFKGTQLFGAESGDAVAAASVKVSGKLTAGRASGTLVAIVKVADRATGEAITSCESRGRGTAHRTGVIVFGVATSQGEPIVLRLDAARRRVNDVIVAWRGPCATSGGYIRIPEHFGNFALKRSGAFGNPFQSEYALDDGGKSSWQYRLTGRVTKTKASGALQAKLSETDAAGAMTETCDSGNVTWKAATG